MPLMLLTLSMDATVRRTLSGIGVAAEDIFTEPIPGNLSLGAWRERG
jgi:hypothetical protein